jgi:hypothetical protein
MNNVEQLFLDDPRADAVLAKTQTADVAVLLPSIKLRHAARITAELVIPARDGAYAELPTDLEPRLAAALHLAWGGIRCAGTICSRLEHRVDFGVGDGGACEVKGAFLIDLLRGLKEHAIGGAGERRAQAYPFHSEACKQVERE